MTGDSNTAKVLIDGSSRYRVTIYGPGNFQIRHEIVNSDTAVVELLRYWNVNPKNVEIVK